MKVNRRRKTFKHLPRRNFIKAGAAASTFLLFPHIKCSKNEKSTKLIYIAIDSLHPDYLSLDAIREIDHYFGVLIEELKKMGAVLVLNYTQPQSVMTLAMT